MCLVVIKKSELTKNLVAYFRPRRQDGAHYYRGVATVMRCPKISASLRGVGIKNAGYNASFAVYINWPNIKGRIKIHGFVLGCC